MEVARTLGMSRANLQLVLPSAAAALDAALGHLPTDVVARVEAALDRPAIAEPDLVRAVVGAEPGPRDRGLALAVARRLGAQPLATFSGRTVEGWWSSDGRRLVTQLGDHLTAQLLGPATSIAAFAAAHGVPEELVRTLLADRACPYVVYQPTGRWVRRKSAFADAAMALLLEAGKPVDRRVFTAALGTYRERIRLLLSTDERFVSTQRGRRGGTVALAQWGRAAIEGERRGVLRYRSTLEAVTEVLRERERPTLAELYDAVKQRYAVHRRSVTGCLVHESIGVWPDGRIGLVAAGAVHHPDPEPPRPGAVAVSRGGRVITLEVHVTRHDLQGLPRTAPRWVVWAAGLRVAPRSRRFRHGTSAQVILRRALGGVTMSGLRPGARSLGLRSGCSLSLRFDLDAGSIEASPACPCHRA